METNGYEKREQFAEEFRLAMAQRRTRRDQPRMAKGVLPVTDAEERAYHRHVADLMVDRGFLSLAESHLVAAKDCPRGCDCLGCYTTRLDVEERRAAKAARQAVRSERARVAA